MPANSVVVTVILTCLLWGSLHHPPFWALLCYSLCLPHSLIFSFHIFTVSLPLAVKCSVSPIFAFLILTNDDLVVKSSGHAVVLTILDLLVVCSVPYQLSSPVFGFWHGPCF